MMQFRVRITHNGWCQLRAKSEKDAKQQALTKLAMHGWAFVNDEAIVLEVDRVYETRWDCI